MPLPSSYRVLRPLSPCLGLMLTASACNITSLDDIDIDLCKNSPEVVASVSLQPKDVSMRVGDAVSLELTQLGADGQTVFLCIPAPEWTTANPSVATILSGSDVSGSVRAVGPGSTVITVRSGGKSASTTVTVTDARIAAIAIEPQQLSLRVGQTIDLAVSARDSAGNAMTVRSVAWAWAPVAFATFTSSGRLTALDTGTVTVRATVEGTSVIARIPITRDPPAVRLLKISAGHQHTCAVVAGGTGVPSGSAYCWGSGSRGQLGNGTLADRWEPSRVAGTNAFTAISAGQTHTCAIASGGAAYCWGSNEAGQLGDGTLTTRTSPVRVATTLAFRDIAVVDATSCGLVENGAAYCWGRALGSNAQVMAPSALPGGLRFAELLDGGWAFMCGRTLTRQVYCWGEFPGRTLTNPTLTSGSILFEHADAGMDRVCGISTSGTSYCWGSLGSQQVTVPTELSSFSRFSTLAVGWTFTCGIADTGAYCLGATGLGGSGSGDTAPSAIPDERHHPFAMISASASHACAIDTTGGGWCWGRNYEGQVGIGEPYPNPLTPRQVLIR